VLNNRKVYKWENGDRIMEEYKSRYLEKYNKKVPVQNEFLSQPLETDSLIVVNDTICLYD